MYEALEQFQLAYGHLVQPLIVGTLVAIVCSLIGCFIVLRKMSFLADAIAHAMLAGVIAGYLFMKFVFNQEAAIGAMLFGAMLAGIVTVALIGFVTRVSRVKQDTAIGIMYTGIFALGAFVISTKEVSKHIHIDIYHFIVGSVLSVSSAELWLLGIVTSIVVGVIILFYRQLQLTSFDPVMAASIGIPVLAIDYMLTACTSLVVVSGVKIAGVILVVALIITPAASAYLLFDKLKQMLWGSAIIGVLGFWIGFWFATVTGAAPGASIVVVSTSIFLLILVFAPRYGMLADWIRKRSSVPQEVMEDVLGAILRAEGNSVPVAEIISKVTSKSMKIRRAVQLLARRQLLEVEDDKVELTENGEREAKRLVRAHRLWETYLKKTGTPDQEIHERAHILEHISDQATVDYLDDKLGHPLTDPHGTEIPEDAMQLETPGPFKASLLREGYRAELHRIEPAARELELSVGQIITMGPRSADGATWTIISDTGLTLQLNHDQSDALIVELVSKEPN